MDEFSLPFAVLDLSKSWKKIESALINAGPFKITPNLKFSRDETIPSLFTTTTVSPKTLHAACHLYLIPYEGKFENSHLQEIKRISSTLSLNENQLVLILTMVKSIFSSKSKIETQFKSSISNLSFYIVKLHPDPPYVSDQTALEIHQKLEKSITKHVEEQTNLSILLFKKAHLNLQNSSIIFPSLSAIRAFPATRLTIKYNFCTNITFKNIYNKTK